jgi:hypothetical protein
MASARRPWSCRASQVLDLAVFDRDLLPPLSTLRIAFRHRQPLTPETTVIGTVFPEWACARRAMVVAMTGWW